MPLGGSSAALKIGSAFMSDLGSLFPAKLKLTGGELEFTFVLRETHPHADVSQWVERHPDAGRLRVSLDAGGRCARAGVELAGTAVRAVIVLPEEMPSEAVNAPYLGPWQDRVPTLVQLALDELARVLARCHHRAGGAEPLIDLELGYRPDHGYGIRLAGAHASVRRFVAPVRPVLELRWLSATSAQRKAFAGSLAGGPPARRWPRRRLTTRIMGLEVKLPV